MYVLNSILLNGGPLSLLLTQGIPCVANILSSFNMVVVPVVERMISTSGNREYASMATRKYSLVGKGP